MNREQLSDMERFELNEQMLRFGGFKPISCTDTVVWLAPDGKTIYPAFTFTNSLDWGFQWLVPPTIAELKRRGRMLPLGVLLLAWEREWLELEDETQYALALCLAISKLVGDTSHEPRGEG